MSDDFVSLRKLKDLVQDPNYFIFLHVVSASNPGVKFSKNFWKRSTEFFEDPFVELCLDFPIQEISVMDEQTLYFRVLGDLFYGNFS